MNYLIEGFRNLELWKSPNQDSELRKPLLKPGLINSDKEDEENYTALGSLSFEDSIHGKYKCIVKWYANHSASFKEYLCFTSVCKRMYECRFGRMHKRTDFLNILLSRVVVKDRFFVRLICNEGMKINERVSLIIDHFLKDQYGNDICLVLSDNTIFNQSAFNLVVKKFPNIKKLIFSPDHEIECKDFFHSVNLCSQLTDLVMPDCLSNYRPEGHCKNIPQSVKSLRVSRDIAKMDLFSIVGCSTNLETLDLSENDVDKDFYEKVIFPDSLRRLNLDDTYLDINGVRKIVETYTNLEWISLQDCEDVTSQGMAEIIFPAGLERRFKECEEI